VLNCINCPNSFDVCIQCSIGYAVIKNQCQTVCGDSIIMSPNEECDDGNTVNNDGCSSTCKVENDFNCAPSATLPYQSVC
jgi:Notch-like protein